LGCLVALNLMEADMMYLRNVLGCVIVLATVLSLTVASAWALGEGAKPRGDVRPCDLSGVNPAYHPGIFRDLKIAAAYGFVKRPDGKWTVIPNCHISS
jgi:hypothetical protein